MVITIELLLLQPCGFIFPKGFSLSPSPKQRNSQGLLMKYRSPNSNLAHLIDTLGSRITSTLKLYGRGDLIFERGGGGEIF